VKAVGVVAVQLPPSVDVARTSAFRTTSSSTPNTISPLVSSRMQLDIFHKIRKNSCRHGKKISIPREGILRVEWFAWDASLMQTLTVSLGLTVVEAVTQRKPTTARSV